MSEHFQALFAERIGGVRFGRDTQVYKFEKIRRARNAAKAERPDRSVIDFGVGEPDRMADARVVATLAREAADPSNRMYADNGIIELQKAIVDHMAAIYGVTGLDPTQNVMHALGGKSALSYLPAAFINPGDVVLQTVPGYPVLATHARWYGAEVVPLPLKPENGFLPDLDGIDAALWKRVKILVLNYPNNPTGAVASRAFYEKAVELARRHEFLIVSDLAYGALTLGDEKPLSLMSVPGAFDCAIEVHSFSKAFNMTGWRLAWVVGAAPLVNAFGYVKDNSDSGQFRAIQKAGVSALSHPDITRGIAAHYERRLHRLAAILRECGFSATAPRAGFFLYVPAPKGGVREDGECVNFAGAEAACDFLIRQASIVTVPWDDAGAYLRFSATFEAANEAAEEAVYTDLTARLARLQLRF